MARAAFAALGFLFALGCATGPKYPALYSHLRAGDCKAATEHVEKQEKAYGANQRLLFLMDAGAVSLYCGQHEKSNGYLHEADRLAEDLWTKSITREGAAFLINDYTIPYSGEDFEKAFINMLSAVNYAVLGQYDEALVECRRLNGKLVEINEKYEKKSVYKEDAFGRYLSGMLYEADSVGSLSNIDNAFIDYDRAFDAFRDYAAQYGTPLPDVFLEDYFRIAEAAERLDEAKAKVGPRANLQWMSHRDARKRGKIVLIHMRGRAPVKEEDKVVLPAARGPITMAFPRYVVSRPGCRSSELVVKSSSAMKNAESELVEDVAGIAVKNLDDRKGRVVAKTLARAVAKQVAIDAAARQAGDRHKRELTRLGLNILNIVIERADTRSWRTLPAEISLTRLYVAPGQYEVSAQTCGERRMFSGSTGVKAGETKFLLLVTGN